MITHSVSLAAPENIDSTEITPLKTTHHITEAAICSLLGISPVSDNASMFEEGRRRGLELLAELGGPARRGRRVSHKHHVKIANNVNATRGKWYMYSITHSALPQITVWQTHTHTRTVFTQYTYKQHIEMTSHKPVHSDTHTHTHTSLSLSSQLCQSVTESHLTSKCRPVYWLIKISKEAAKTER